MPQTGPRPVYTAPPVADIPPSAAAGTAPGGIRRGRADLPQTLRRSWKLSSAHHRRPSRNRPVPRRSAPQATPRAPPLAVTQAPARLAPPGSRPAFGARPGFGAPRPGGPPRPGSAPPTGEAPRPQRAPSRGRGGRPQYPKTKEGPMKGFVPPPRYAGVQYGGEPLPITRENHCHRGHQRKGLGGKARRPRQGSHRHAAQ